MEKNLLLILIIIVAAMLMRRRKMIHHSEKVLNDFLRLVASEVQHASVDGEFLQLQEKEKEEKLYTLVSRYKSHLPTLLASISVFPKRYKYANGGAYIKRLTDKLFDLIQTMYQEKRKGSSIEKISILYVKGTKDVVKKSQKNQNKPVS